MNNQYTPIQQPKKSNTGLIIGIVVVVILCCCCLISIGGYMYMKSQTNSIFSSINQQLQATSMAPGGGSIDSAMSTAEAMATQAAQGTMPAMPTGGDSAVATAEALATQAAQGTAPAMPNMSTMIPQGGLGDDTLRADAWGYVIAASALKGCNATDASKTTITVSQQPDSSTGIWVEKWTVTCMDNSKASFDVTFTPSSGGGTDVSVTASK